MKKFSFVAVFTCGVLLAGGAFAQDESMMPADVGTAPTPMMENSSPIVQEGQVPGTVVQPGVQGGASCLDCPSSAAAGPMMGGCSGSLNQTMSGQMMGQPMMADGMMGQPIMSGGDCGCTSGSSGYMNSWDSGAAGCSSCGSSGEWYSGDSINVGGCSSCGGGCGGWSSCGCGSDCFGYPTGSCGGWYGGTMNRGFGWLGRRGCGCGY